MLNLQLAHKYAMAIFEIAKEENKLDEYGEELSLAGQVVAEHPELRAFLGNPKVQREDKKDVLSKLLKDDLSKMTYNFIMLLVDKRRDNLIEAISHEYMLLSNKEQGIVIADVTEAFPMTGSQEERLKQKLEEITEKTVKLRHHIDERIIGGVIVQMGDKRIDGSVAGQMQSLKKQLLASM